MRVGEYPTLDDASFDTQSLFVDYYPIVVCGFSKGSVLQAFIRLDLQVVCCTGKLCRSLRECLNRLKGFESEPVLTFCKSKRKPLSLKSVPAFEGQFRVYSWEYSL